MAQRGDKLIRSMKAIGGAILATLAVRWVAVTAVEIPPEFPPLDGPGPTIFFTTVASIGAVVVFLGLHRFTSKPERAFRWIAAVVLLLSFLPDLWLLSDGAAESFPGATPTGVGVLMTMHVVAAAVIVWALTAGDHR